MWEAVRPLWMDGVLKVPRVKFPDGDKVQPTDAVFAMQRISVPAGEEASFESEYAPNESELRAAKGFKGSLILRRDGQKARRQLITRRSLSETRARHEGDTSVTRARREREMSATRA